MSVSEAVDRSAFSCVKSRSRCADRWRWCVVIPTIIPSHAHQYDKINAAKPTSYEQSLSPDVAKGYRAAFFHQRERCGADEVVQVKATGAGKLLKAISSLLSSSQLIYLFS